MKIQAAHRVAHRVAHRTLHQTTNALQRLKATGYLPAKNLSYKKEMINTDIATLSRICKNQALTITKVKANSASI